MGSWLGSDPGMAREVSVPAMNRCWLPSADEYPARPVAPPSSQISGRAVPARSSLASGTFPDGSAAFINEWR